MVGRPRRTITNQDIQLSREFFARDAALVARQLLGCVIVHETPQGIISGRIVETEAYKQDDEASHSYHGQTKRNAVMFGQAGHAYVYFTYGMHWCFNVVTGQAGQAEAALIRALEPLEGIALMQANRNRQKLTDLCSGPAKLVQALGISASYNGADITMPPLYIYGTHTHQKIITTTRIGINVAIDKPLRFYISGNPHISKK